MVTWFLIIWGATITIKEMPNKKACAVVQKTLEEAPNSWARNERIECVGVDDYIDKGKQK